MKKYLYKYEFNPQKLKFDMVKFEIIKQNSIFVQIWNQRNGSFNDIYIEKLNEFDGFNRYYSLEKLKLNDIKTFLTVLINSELNKERGNVNILKKKLSVVNKRILKLQKKLEKYNGRKKSN